MNLFDENRPVFVSKFGQDRAENFAMPLIKSKTPVPKRMSKETLKNYKKKVMKKSNTSKNEKTTMKSSTNGMRDSNSYFKRTKSKGSVSVEYFNGSKEIQRPHSVISKSFFNHLELAQKVKSVEKNSNQLNIEKIIKKSLLKAKSNKLSKEKYQKQGLIQNEIRRQEIKYQNNQIRIQNSQNMQRKKSKKRSKRSNKSTKVVEIFPKAVKSNSVTQYPKDYLSKMQEFYLNDYGKSKNGSLNPLLKKVQKDSEYFEEISDIQMHELSEDSGKEHENFSFIKTDDFKDKKSRKENSLADGQLSKSLDLSIQRQEYLNEEKIDYAIENKAQKKVLSLSYQSSIKIVKIPRKLSMFNTLISIWPEPKKTLQLAAQSQIDIEPLTPTLSKSFHPITCFKKTNTLTHSNTLNIPSSLSTNTQSLVDQVSEDLSSTLTTLFLIEQLKLSELSLISDLSKLIPADVNKNLTYQIEKKFTSVINYLQPDIELRTAKYVSSLSKAENSEFLLKTQKKKQNLHSFLNEIKANENFIKKISASNENESGSSSSSDDQMQGLGISHSRSVIRLHEDFYSTTEVKGSEIDFGFKESSPEPAVPVLNLALKPVECELSESKRVCTIDTLLKYAKKVFQVMKTDRVLNTLKSPLMKNPLSELDKIQDLQIGTFTENQFYFFDPLFEYKNCYNVELFEAGNEYEDQETQKVEKIYKKLILDCINYLLQQFRPFAYYGKPMPWSLNKIDLKTRNFTIDTIVEKILLDLQELNSFAIGKNDDGENSAFEDENAMLKHKERLLDRLIYAEAKVEEERWLDYEFEETQVKIDLADVVLYDLVTEVININNI